ncbi:MAG TPA: hypothetical protein VKN73_09210 [Desulfosalsimonadaceae bacterium]|nr:hypothetical protein [Desulfosalsimonadaceae bacterium]
MAEIGHQALAKHLSDAKKSTFSPVYLIFGEPYLCQKSCQALIDAIVPNSSEQTKCVEAAEHMDRAQVADLLEQLNTYSFFSATQIVVLRNAMVFASPKNREEPVKRIKKAYDNDDMKKAADLFLRLLGQSHMTLEDIGVQVFAEKFNLDADAYDGLDWINPIIRFCRDQALYVPEVADEAALLLNAVKRGFPKNHYLILTTETADKRTSLYKTIAGHGMVIDCSVAKGTRKKDRDAQQQLIYSQAREILAAAGKNMAPRAFEAMYELIGFDMHAFSRGLEKLVNYTGTRETIEVADIQAVLTKSREEPIYELTGAISDKNPVAALRLLAELLNAGYHYLQVLMAITNQVRRLLLIKGFVNSNAGYRWQPRMSYDQFNNLVMPVVQSYDKELMDKISTWTDDSSQTGAGQKKKPTTEQIIARQPKNPYPVYQQFLKASNFSEQELIDAVRRLHQADVSFKTTGRVPEFVLQELIISICGHKDNPKPKT